MTTTPFDVIVDACSTRSDKEVADLILEVEVVRAALLTVLENRYPWLLPIRQEWVLDDDDERPYHQVMFDALNAEMILA